MLQDRKRRLRRERSVTAAALRFAVEPLSQAANELPPLIARFSETHSPLLPDPDWRSLLNLSASGGLIFVSARHDNTLVGFTTSLVGTHNFYAGTKHGWITAIWLEPDFRNGWSGYHLLQHTLDALRDVDCRRAYVARQIGDRRLNVLFRRLGLKMEEVSYAVEL
jgi:GNAT superfamily N-acetyltransferase